MNSFELIDMLITVLKILGFAVSAYFLAIAVFSLKKPKPFAKSAPKTKFAVIIPSRNEEAVIGNLVGSLLEQDYPRELYDIYVVPNNCTDNTAQAAKNAGAKVFTCTGQVKCKGDALNQSLSYLTDKHPEYDAFCVFDADNIVDKKFLAEMNNAFCAGSKIAKGRTEAKNPYESWVSGCYSIYFGMFNIFFNRARASCGLSAKLIGTAFAVSRDFLMKSGGWNTGTIAEDAEFASQCALNGERVAWVPEAVAYDEEPTSFRLSITQRKRWCSGIMQVSALSVPSLFKALRGKNKPLVIDFLAFMLMPLVQAVAFIPLAVSFIHTVLTATTIPALLAATVLPALLYYAGSTALALLISVISGTFKKQMLKSIFTYALFTFSWLPLQTVSLFKKTTKWVEIKHTGRTVLEKSA